MPGHRTIALALLAQVGLAGVAWAHGGAYQPPPEVLVPGNAVPPGVGSGRATTPGGKDRRAVTPGAGSRAAGLIAANPTYPGSWTHWWFANRSVILRSTRISERFRAARTGGEKDPDTRTELWRATARAALARALRDPDRDIASGAAVALGKAGHPAAAPALTRVLRDAELHQTVREGAALGLGLLPVGDAESEPAREALADLVMDAAEPNRLRAMCVYALGLRGEMASLPLLLDAAQAGGTTWDVPAAGITALGLGSYDIVIHDLRKMVRGPRSDGARAREVVRRSYAAHALRLLDANEAVPDLLVSARDENRDVKHSAMLALGALGDRDDPAVVQRLIRALGRSRHESSRAVAALALGRLGGQPAERAVRYVRGTGPLSVRPFCTLALGLMALGQGHDTLKARLRNDLRKGPTGELCIAVGLAQDAEAAGVLRAIVGNERWGTEIRMHAAVALGMVDDRERGAEVLRRVLAKSPDAALRRETALALGMLGDRAAVDVLLRQLEHGKTAHVKGTAAVALGRIGGPETSEALLRLLRDRDEPALARAMAAVGVGHLLDLSGGSRLSEIAADLNWMLLTPTLREILTIL